MATWIEFRCEERGAGIDSSDRCMSDDNEGPMDMAYDDNKSILEVVADLRSFAKKNGWVRRKEGWVCPHCAKRLSLAKDQA